MIRIHKCTGWLRRGLWVVLGLLAQESYAQREPDTTRSVFQFSGTISVTTNGISPIPAFSLDKPAVSAFLSLQRGRFQFDPEMAFSSRGVPWLLNNCFRYRVIEKPRFQLRTGLIWGVGYSYPEVVLNGSAREVAQAERFLWLELLPKYRITEKIALSARTFSGYNFEPGSPEYINYIALQGNFTQLKVYKALHLSLFPQLFYLNIDGAADGLFASGIVGLAHEQLPLVLSSQFNQTVTTTIAPDPGFKWNISLAYRF